MLRCQSAAACCCRLLLLVTQKGAYLFGVADPTQTLLYDHGWRWGSSARRCCAGLPEVYVHLTRPNQAPWELCGATSEGPEHCCSSACCSSDACSGTPCCNSDHCCSSGSTQHPRTHRVALPVPCGAAAPYQSPKSEVLSGVVAIVKSPCMHPGDIQLCYAVTQTLNPKPCITNPNR